MWHDDVIKWKHFPRYWPFVRGIHRSPVIPSQRPVTRSFDVFFDLRLNKRLSKQPWGWWFDTQSCSLWRHCNGNHKDRMIAQSLWVCGLNCFLWEILLSNLQLRILYIHEHTSAMGWWLAIWTFLTTACNVLYISMINHTNFEHPRSDGLM